MKMKRILAFLLAVLMIALVFLTLFFAITGSRYFMASLGAMFLLPILVYSYMFIYRLMRGDREENKNSK